MAVAVIMPRQGNTVESCIITRWHKKPGDKVAPGEILFSYETDKAAFDEEAKVEGTLLAAFFEEGDDVPCLTNVCVVGQPGEDVEPFRPGAPKADTAGPAEASAPAAPAEAPEEAPAQAISDRARISPRARALAASSGADLSRAVPTGPEGRVIARDVQALIDAGLVATPAARGAAAFGAEGTGLGGRVTLADLARTAEAPAPQAAAPAAPEEADSYVEPLSHMRKVIAKSMTLSLATMAQLTHNISFDATEIRRMRALFKEKGEPFGLSRVSINDIVLYAVARTLANPAHRALNANLIDDGKSMRYFRAVHLGMAVDTDRGLMVPTIFHAEKLSLAQISAEAKRLAKACREGKIGPDELRGASFTVSNLGSLGIESFTPVVNPPQTGILGVCAMKDAVRMRDGQIEVYPSVNLSLTYDHRALDGSPASRFLLDLKANLENFALLLAL